ncbi:FxsA family protein [Rhodomicrobium vannielii]|uniref:FxsA family protein n=1 Tax=Rhodomicrobium vannielii TaxID=1069 RepID=UPI00159504F6|nr:FxsA family protein [Rhodomicrobium vannielii]
MPILLFLLFIGLPIAEIALFIEAGRLIGVLPTILLTIGTAIVGSVLMRVQGFSALNRFAQSLERGEMPLTPVIDGIGILAAGILLITPGLLTDVIGLALFVPPIRRAAGRWVVKRALASGRVHVSGFGRPAGGGGAGPRPGAGPKPGGASPRGGGGLKRSSNAVDAEFETLEPDPPKGEPPTGGKAETAKPGRKDTDSPWHKE